MLVFVSVISVTFAAVYHSGYAEDCTIGSSENATGIYFWLFTEISIRETYV